MNRKEVENNISCVRLSVANVLRVCLCLKKERRKGEKKITRKKVQLLLRTSVYISCKLSLSLMVLGAAVGGCGLRDFGE